MHATISNGLVTFLVLIILSLIVVCGSFCFVFNLTKLHGRRGNISLHVYLMTVEIVHHLILHLIKILLQTYP